MPFILASFEEHTHVASTPENMSKAEENPVDLTGKQGCPTVPPFTAKGKWLVAYYFKV